MSHVLEQQLHISPSHETHGSKRRETAVFHNTLQDKSHVELPTNTAVIIIEIENIEITIGNSIGYIV